MKIVAVDIFPIRLRSIKPFYEDGAHQHFGSQNTVIIRVRTDTGAEGLGEASSNSAYFNQTLGSLTDWLQAYAAALKDRDPMKLVQAHLVMDRISGEFPPGCQPARAAFDMALLDIAGKTFGCPVYELLGGAYRTEFDALTSVYEPLAESAREACEHYVGQGYAALKVKVGHRLRREGFSQQVLDDEAGKLVSILTAIPGTIRVDADANQSWKNAKAVVQTLDKVLTRTNSFNLSIEQPLHHQDLDGHRYIRQSLRIPVILDESVQSPEAILQIIKHGAADRIVLKHARVGGLTKARKIAVLCEAESVGISVDTVPHTLLGDTASCHLAATLRDPYPIDAGGHRWFEENPFSGGAVFRGGKFFLSDQPGLGVKLDEGKLQELLVH